MNKHDSAHEFDAALAAQKSGGFDSRHNTMWAPKAHNDKALKAVMLAWAQQLAQAWNGGNAVKVMGGKVGVGASVVDQDKNLGMIWLDDAVTMPRSAKDLAAAVGIIAHELGHLKHTVKTNDVCTQMLQKDGVWRTFNMVEDGKQEMKMLAVRPGYKKYLEFAVLQHLLKTVQPDSIQTLYPLVAGRTYLPPKLIERAREFCVDVYGDETIDRFDELLADFLEIDPLVDPIQTVAIINEIAGLFPSPSGCGLTPTAGDTDSNPELSGDEVRERKEKAKEKGDKKKSKPKKEKGEKSDKEETSEDDEPKPGSDDDAEHDEDEDKDAGGGEKEGDESEDQREGDGDQEAEGDGDGDQKGESGSESGDSDSDGDEEDWLGDDFDDDEEGWDPLDSPDLDGDEDEDERDDDREGESKTPKAKTAGLGKGKDNSENKDRDPEDNPVQKVLDVLRNLHEQIEEDLVADLNEDYELMRSEAFGDGDIRRPLPSEEDSQRDMVAALKRMAEQAKGGLDRRRPKGRLNVRRFIQNKERMDVERIVFDKFRPNVSNALDMEVVLLVDNSGSIGGVTEQLSGAMWALVTALESVGGPSVTVVLWNSSFEVKKVPTDKWRAKYVPNINATGGTSPHEAIKYANQLFKFSRKKQNLCFILTDGAWGGMELARQLIVQMKTENNVDTYILGFAGFNPENVSLYGAVDGCSGGLDEVTAFIFKIAEDRINGELAARGR